MKNKILKMAFILASVVVFIVIAGIYFLYQKVYTSNVAIKDKETFYLYIPTGGNFENVTDSLKAYKILKNPESFEWVSKLKKYTIKVQAGRYELKNGMSNNTLVNMLRIGNQKPVNMTFNTIRTKSELAKKISEQMEFDSDSLMQLLDNKNYLEGFGFTPESVISMFIPNTYQLKWNNSPQEFFEKMNKEYEKFWSPSREAKLKNLRMNKLEVSTLASIVQAEQSVRNDEKARVAGLYINRLKEGMLLESDPTIVYAIGDFSIRRVLNRDKEINSPYNTYKYAGLPPGPINLPEISSIDAVLNYEKHHYIFMCAKEDFSGYHNFSSNLSQHNLNARKYQMALNRKGIRR
jgi:UPF0755 protein